MIDIEGIDFKKGDGLVTAVVQDALTGKVLMTGWMNREAVEATQRDGKVTFWSRSRQQLWTKGETSGNSLHLDSIKLDCDGDTLLVTARPSGPVCHTGADTCFGDENQTMNELSLLERIISSRLATGKDDSYTARLAAAGVAKVAQKVGEEAVELVIEATSNNRERFLEEGADLVYHLLVLLQVRGCTMDDIRSVLRRRREQRGG